MGKKYSKGGGWYPVDPSPDLQTYVLMCPFPLLVTVGTACLSLEYSFKDECKRIIVDNSRSFQENSSYCMVAVSYRSLLRNETLATSMMPVDYHILH